MPKIVDHDQRRVELVGATWRIIAREGIEGATLREIAAEAGFANGALKPYFPTKDDLLAFAFAHVFDQTNGRIDASMKGKSGLAAIRAFCLEVLPLDETRLNEARIVIPFWQKALTDGAKAELHESFMEQWRNTLLQLLGEARSAGELTRGADGGQVAGNIINLVLGAQVTALLSKGRFSAGQLTAQLDAYLGLLKAG